MSRSGSQEDTKWAWPTCSGWRCRCSRTCARVQQELAETTVEGTAGGGVVKAVVTGKQELVSVTIDPSAVDPADVEMLQDLIVAAVNDALAGRPRAGRGEDGGRHRRSPAARNVALPCLRL